jgi:hypothetical protein
MENPTTKAMATYRQACPPKGQIDPVDPNLPSYEALQVFPEERRNAGI